MGLRIESNQANPPIELPSDPIRAFSPIELQFYYACVCREEQVLYEKKCPYWGNPIQAFSIAIPIELLRQANLTLKVFGYICHPDNPNDVLKVAQLECSLGELEGLECVKLVAVDSR